MGQTAGFVSDFDRLSFGTLRDGVPDLVAIDKPGDVHVLLGNGDGSFQWPLYFSAGPSAGWVAVADLDGDGAHDLVTANSGSVTVLLNLRDPPLRQVPTVDPLGTAILLSLLGATAYWRLRASASVS